ncbi:MAG: glycosyl hydrolase family 28-related protein [Planctomycetota bacterium]|jgi:hypothetical protein
MTPYPAPRITARVSLCLLTVVVGVTANAQTSDLWGHRGELWRDGGRLPDFSYAGYRRGEADLPERPAQLNARDFGAVGDGKADDTAAIQKALDAAAGKTLLLPAGRYKISDWLTIRASGTVLRGAGSQKTVLVFHTPLNNIHPNWGATTSGLRTSNYSWSGGYLRVSGRPPSELLGRVAGVSRRGDRVLRVSALKGIEAGMMVVLIQSDRGDNSLAKHLYDEDAGDVRNLEGRVRQTFAARVARLDASRGEVELDRALLTDVRPEWEGRLYSTAGMVREVGIEGIGFEFPNTPYRGHFTELGFNALAMDGARDCWLRDIRIHNSDSGLNIDGFNHTVEGVLMTSDRARDERLQATGHHGISLKGQDILLKGFEIRTRFVHDITVNRESAGNVSAQGRGEDLALDHHRFGPHSNLFTDLDLGVGSRMFRSGGGRALGRHSAAFTTFWNVRAEKGQVWPEGWGPDRMNLVGVKAAGPGVKETGGRWFEVFGREGVAPVNLYEAQLARRLGGASP